MVERNHYDIRFECKYCGIQGVLHISENNQPYIRKLSRSLDGVEGDFDAEMQGNVQFNITCRSCNQRFII